VGDLIVALLEIYCSLQQWKKFANPPRIDKVIATVRVAPFLTHGVDAVGQCIPPPRHVLPVQPSGESVRTADLCPLTTFRISQQWRIWKTIPDPDGDPDRHQNLIICSLAHCQPSLKILYKSIRTFLRKVVNRQTDRQTNNDDYITSLAEVVKIYDDDDGILRHVAAKTTQRAATQRTASVERTFSHINHTAGI